MNDKLSESVIVKDFEYIKPLIHKIDSIFDNCIRDCHDKAFHTFDHFCVYDIQITNIINDEIVNLTIADKSMSLEELNKNLRNCSRKWISIYSNE